jgi:hypothetical protein
MKLPQLIRIIILFLFALSTSQCEQIPSKKIRFDFTIIEDDKTAVPAADVTFTFGRIPESSQVVHQGLSDAQGKFVAEDGVVFGLLLTIQKENYYSIYERDPLKSIAPDQYDNLRQHSMDITMRKVRKPIPLLGKVVNRAIAEQNKPIGYDLEIGDWVKPYGKGVVGDFFVNYSKQMVGYSDGETYESRLQRMLERHKSNPQAKKNYLETVNRFHETALDYTYADAIQHNAGKWKGTLHLSFADKDEGIIEVKDAFLSYSELTMPHLAPENGYKKEWNREEDNAKPRINSSEIGYFLRTRIKRNEKGEIVSANYSKIVTDWNFDPRGRIEFSYLFNPSANDRNLEFDTKKNLFSNLANREQIQKP